LIEFAVLYFRRKKEARLAHERSAKAQKLRGIKYVYVTSIYGLLNLILLLCDKIAKTREQNIFTCALFLCYWYFYHHCSSLHFYCCSYHFGFNASHCAFFLWCQNFCEFFYCVP